MWQREEEFRGLLNKAVTNASKSSIEQLTDLAIADQTWCYKHVCALVEKQMAKAAMKHRKNVVYVMSSICRQSKARLGSKDKYGQRFGQMLQRCAKLLEDAPSDDLGQVEKVVRSWRKEGIFSADALSEFEGALEQAASRAMAGRPRQRQPKQEMVSWPAASPEAPAPDMDFDPGHTFEDDGASAQPSAAVPMVAPANSRGGWGARAAAAEKAAAYDLLAAGGLRIALLPPPPADAPWDRLAKKARGSRWGAPMPGAGDPSATQPRCEPRLPPPPAPAPPAASAPHHHHPAMPAAQSRSHPLNAPGLPPSPHVQSQPQPPSAQQLGPPLPLPPPAAPTEASEGLKRALAIAARLTRSGDGQLAQQAGSASLPAFPPPMLNGGSQPLATSATPPAWAPPLPPAPPVPAAPPPLAKSSSFGAPLLGQMPGLSAEAGAPAAAPGDAGSLLLSMLGPPAPRKPGPPHQHPAHPRSAHSGASQGGSASSNERALPMPPQLTALFAATRPLAPPPQPPPQTHQAWQGAQARPAPAMNPLPPAPAGHTQQYGAFPGWAAHPPQQASAPLPWNGLHHAQQLPGAGQPAPWFGPPRPPPPIPGPAPPPGNPGAVAGPHVPPPPPPAAAPPALPADPYVSQDQTVRPTEHAAEHHAAEDGAVPPPPPDEPQTACAGEGRAADSQQPDEASGEAGTQASAPMVGSAAPPPPPPPQALPAQKAAPEEPSQPLLPSSPGVMPPQQTPVDNLTRSAPDGSRVVQTATQHAQLPDAPAQNGHAAGDGEAASVQVNSAGNSSALDDVWSAAACVLPDIAALQSPKAIWRQSA